MQSSTSKIAAMAAEVARLAETELARRRLLDFTIRTMPQFRVARHHHYICERVDRWLAGGYGDANLSISMPPRHTKSELCSVRLPAMLLGQEPEKSIIHISYAASLTNEFSRRVRELVRDSVEYRELFPHVRLNMEKQAVTNWRLEQGGGFQSVGQGGGVTGHGAHTMIIDDIHKEGDHLSPKVLLDTMTWYVTAARTRLMPGGSVLLVGTRWDNNDLFGRVYRAEASQPNADKWIKVVLPGIAKEDDELGRAPGEALWPDWYPVEDLLALKALDEPMFRALYQQEPDATTMDMFDRSKFVLMPLDDWGSYAHEGTFVFDLALGQNERSDYHAWAEVAVNRSTNTLYFRGLHRERCTWPEAKRQIKRLIERYPNHHFAFPEHQLELMALQELHDEYPDDTHRIFGVSQKGDKVERAQVAAARSNVGAIVLDENDPEHTSWLEEICDFGSAPHDDTVDVLSCACHHFGMDRLLYEAIEQKAEAVETTWDRLMRVNHAAIFGT